MKKSALTLLAGTALLVGSTAATAATMNVTASFSPSMGRPENNAFTNTTVQSGYCATWPAQCPSGLFSIALPLTTSITHPISAMNAPRDGVYFGLPGLKRPVIVTNIETNASSELQFRVNLISAKAQFSSDVGGIGGSIGWAGYGGFVYEGPPCTYTGHGYYSTEHWYAFAWGVPGGNVACYKVSSIDRTGPYAFIDFSVGYDLITPNPLQMEAGVYTGTLSLSVGPGGDFDFGDNYQASDTVLDINFTLSVNHELKLTTTAESQNVSLQPCAQGRTCTEDEGKANWERWMVTRITPQMTGKSNFSLSSSGAFTVYLQCEQQSESGSDCALRSDNTPLQTVPVQTLLTLPANIVDITTASAVTKRRLAVGRDLTKNVFVTREFGQDQSGSIDFLVGQKDVDTMLKNRPDTYRGAVTVIFDPKIY